MGEALLALLTFQKVRVFVSWPVREDDHSLEVGLSYLRRIFPGHQRLPDNDRTTVTVLLR